MRNFTDSEKEFITEIVGLKQSCNFDGLKFRHMIDKYIPQSYIRWTDQSWNSDKFTLYTPSNENIEINSYFNNLIDFIFFLEELESLSLIKFVSDFSYASSYKVLFDTTVYNIVQNSSELKYKSNKSINLSDFTKTEYQFGGLTKSIKKLTDCILYPLPLLEQLVRDDFEDLPYKQYKEEKAFNSNTLNLTRKSLNLTNESLNLTRKSVKLTFWSIIISALGCIAAWAAAYISYKCPERIIKFDEQQLTKIESAISIDTVNNI